MSRVAFATKAKAAALARCFLVSNDEEGLLHHVGFSSSIPERDKISLTSRLNKLSAPPGFTGNAQGAPNRWSTERSVEWEPPKPKLVVEVRYDHTTGKRFRTTRRWCAGGQTKPRVNARGHNYCDRKSARTSKPRTCY